MLVNDGQAHRGFRKNIFNPVLKVVGIACGNHASGGSIAQFEYAKGILKEGQMQQINVTVTDQVSDELIQKMKKMGIDTDKIKFNTKKPTPDAKTTAASTTAAAPSKNKATPKGVTPTAGAAKTRQFQVESTSVEKATA